MARVEKGVPAVSVVVPPSAPGSRRRWFCCLAPVVFLLLLSGGAGWLLAASGVFSVPVFSRIVSPGSIPKIIPDERGIEEYLLSSLRGSSLAGSSTNGQAPSGRTFVLTDAILSTTIRRAIPASEYIDRDQTVIQSGEGELTLFIPLHDRPGHLEVVLTPRKEAPTAGGGVGGVGGGWRLDLVSWKIGSVPLPNWMLAGTIEESSRKLFSVLPSGENAGVPHLTDIQVHPGGVEIHIE
ncbi:hypothetical protein HYV73_01405 [Candidatus Uhrbacteria bacterium]|nr:hypothetical protein [Candidatus Uhrbacteria bacterium]